MGTALKPDIRRAAETICVARVQSLLLATLDKFVTFPKCFWHMQSLQHDYTIVTMTKQGFDNDRVEYVHRGFQSCALQLPYMPVCVAMNGQFIDIQPRRLPFC